MANIRTKSDKITPFGGLFSSLERFDALLSETIDSTLGLRITRNGYSKIFRSLMCAYLCGGSCVEDISNAFEQFGLNAASRVKAFVFKFVSVPAKWVMMARQHVLNVYISNPAYSSLFKKEYG